MKRLNLPSDVPSAAARPAAPIGVVPDAVPDPAAFPAGLLWLDGEGRITRCNARAASWLALGPFEAPIERQAWTGRLGEPSRSRLATALRDRQGFSIDWATPWQVNLPTWLQLDATPLGAGWQGLLHDVSAAQQSRAEAREAARRFRLLVEDVPALIASFDVDSLRCLYANEAYSRAFGAGRGSVIGLGLGEIVGEAVLAEIGPRFRQACDFGQPVSYERPVPGRGGVPQWMEVHLLPKPGLDGRIATISVLMVDITRHRQAERAMRESEERLGKFMDASVEGIVFHRDGVVTDANPPLCELLGFSLPEMLGRRTLEFIAPDQIDRVSAVMRSGAEISYESVLVHRDGHRIPVEFIVRTMTRHGEHLRMTIVRDIRDRQADQARIHHLAHHDPLTGLPNRMAFIERLEQLTASHRGGEARLALLFVDLDQFKRVNDSLGHLAGDRLLQTVAARITAVLRATDVVSRFGGDEFLVLLGGAGDRAVVEEVARKLLVAIGAPIEVEGRPISITPSIGVAMFPAHGRSPTELIRHADAAMYRAKASGRATVRFFEPRIVQEAYSSLVLEGELAQAIERGEFVLHFQPQVRARDGRLAGAEALIRWQHPTRGLLRPDDFIDLAEQRRLMLEIGLWVLSEAARCAQSWQLGPLAGVPVAVNLSSLQFQSPDFVEGVLRVLERTGLSGHLLELELTERMLMADVSAVKATLAPLQRAGIRISVDDFGTGYSALGHLRQLPIDKLKVDHSFVRDLPQDADAAAIARAVIQMGRSLGLTVIAEGVEREGQRDFLLQEGCDLLQGSLIGEAVDQEAFERRWTGAMLQATLGCGPGGGFSAP